jgi:hypothetical protein
MERRVLIVANRTVATPTLLEHVEELAHERPTTFALLIPGGGDSPLSDWTMSAALKVLRKAADGPVEGIAAPDDTDDAIRDAVAHGGYDEIVISTLPEGMSNWLARDLPHRVEELGVPVTVVTHDHAERVQPLGTR